MLGDIVGLVHSHGIGPSQAEALDGRRDETDATLVDDPRRDLDRLLLRGDPRCVPRDLVRLGGGRADVIVEPAVQGAAVPLAVVAVAFPIEVFIEADEVDSADRFRTIGPGNEPRPVAENDDASPVAQSWATDAERVASRRS